MFPVPGRRHDLHAVSHLYRRSPNILKNERRETAVYFAKQPEGDAERRPQQRSMEFVQPSRSAGRLASRIDFVPPLWGPYTRANPVPAKVVKIVDLCGGGSEKDNRHFELDLKGLGLNYEVGMHQ